MIAITDVILLMGGVLAGFIGGRLTKRTKAPGRDPNACTCGHARGMHVDGTGRCCGRTGPTASGNVCTCQIWDGPERPEDIIRGFQL